jgi:hypothetical protein
MIKESIWSRQRRLKKDEKDILEVLRNDFRSMSVELDNDDWKAAAVSSDSITTACIKLHRMKDEIEDVDWIVGSFDRINERMEQLETALTEAGIGI